MICILSKRNFCYYLFSKLRSSHAAARCITVVRLGSEVHVSKCGKLDDEMAATLILSYKMQYNSDQVVRLGGDLRWTCRRYFTSPPGSK